MSNVAKSFPAIKLILTRHKNFRQSRTKFSSLTAPADFLTMEHVLFQNRPTRFIAGKDLATNDKNFVFHYFEISLSIEFFVICCQNPNCFWHVSTKFSGGVVQYIWRQLRSLPGLSRFGGFLSPWSVWVSKNRVGPFSRPYLSCMVTPL